MSLAYRLLYRIGFTPWEQMGEAPFADEIVTLSEREESGREPPHGSALDIGCGSGIWATKLAQREWQVSGVDNVPRALARARERAREEDVELRLVEADVTAMEESDVVSGFRSCWTSAAFMTSSATLSAWPRDGQ